MAKTVTHSCDVTASTHSTKILTSRIVPVVFHTEQNEGRGIAEHERVFSAEKIDICTSCWDTLIQNYSTLQAWGAQGHNQYHIPRGVLK